MTNDGTSRTDGGSTDASLHVVLVRPQIHWNTGNIGRSCLAAGAQLHLVGPLGFSLDDRRVRRAGLDYWKHVEPLLWSSWEEFEGELPSLGEPLFFSSRPSRPYWEVPLTARPVLIFGREDGGLPEEIHERHAGRFCTIPMAHPAVRSLNLSSAVAIGLYDIVRKRN
jgi:tRNA (cytidine/uridine-2'-O-)-methyltransferase